MLWLTFPDAWRAATAAAGAHNDVLLPVRAALVVAWQVAGWWTVVLCLRRAPSPVRRRGGGRVNAATGLGRRAARCGSPTSAPRGDADAAPRRPGLADPAAAGRPPLLDDEHDLAEEGVGFGVPVLKRGLQTVFPGSDGR